MKRALHALVGALVLCTPGLALACPVCFSAKNEASRVAFLGTTVFLTALPLLMVGGVVMWLMKQAEAAGRAEAEQPSPPVDQSDAIEPVTVVRSRPADTAGDLLPAPPDGAPTRA